MLRRVLQFTITVLVITVVWACAPSGAPTPTGLGVPAFNNEPMPFTNDPVLDWNSILMQAHAYDVGLPNSDQGGPTHASRAFAIVHLAIYDSVNSIARRFTPYLTDLPAPGANLPAAVASAAHETLRALFPQQAGPLDRMYADYLSRIAERPDKAAGVSLGTTVAQRLLEARRNDRSGVRGSYVPVSRPGIHLPDPINPDQGFLDPAWGNVMPFATRGVRPLRVPPPPPLGSPEYQEALQEVAALGGDGINTRTQRSPEQTLIGIFWAYDGTPRLGTPLRFFNQIAQLIARQMGNDPIANSRLFALINTGMADVGIQCWGDKYRYSFWRPVVALRATIDPQWTPLGAPLSNSHGNNFTPNFPAYTSGHASFGAVLFRSLYHFYGRDQVDFEVVSDELNGVTTDNQGRVRPRVPRRFHSFSQAAEENGQSRIYLGVHWKFDKTQGIAAGEALADQIFRNYFTPRPRAESPRPRGESPRPRGESPRPRGESPREDRGRFESRARSGRAE